MYRLLIASVAASLATSVAARAPIIVVQGVPTVRVSTAGVDLQSSKGRKHLTRRIRLEAERVCVGTVVETGITAPISNPCYVAAVTSGMSQMNALAGL